MAAEIHLDSKPRGIAERAITRWLMRAAHIRQINQISPHFRLITFEGEALQGVRWKLGDKLQLKLDNGLSHRSYTPLGWDSVQGRTQLLVYCHQQGPGSRWAEHAALGETRYVFGPRHSLPLQDWAVPLTLFGDETSFAVAAAIQAQRPHAQPHYVFEVNDVVEASEVIARLELGQVRLIQRCAADTHLESAIAAIRATAMAGTGVVLTGKASSIQIVRRQLKAGRGGAWPLLTRPYWAPGKSGLD